MTVAATSSSECAASERIASEPVASPTAALASVRAADAAIDDNATLCLMSCIDSKMLLGAQRKLDHPFEELVGGQPDKIVYHEFLGVEAHEVSQLQRLAARGIHEVAVAIIDDDDIALDVESCTHELST